MLSIVCSGLGSQWARGEVRAAFESEMGGARKEDMEKSEAEWGQAGEGRVTVAIKAAISPSAGPCCKC